MNGRVIQPDDIVYFRRNSGLVFQAGNVLSPYKLLDPIGHGIPDYEAVDETIEEGGTAMMAWSRMQFDDVPEKEREATFKALLEYCELDTLAMVMIYQHWEWLKKL